MRLLGQPSRLAATTAGILLLAAGQAAATSTRADSHRRANLPPSAANAQSDLKNAQTVVESDANGNGGVYPTTPGETLRAAFRTDPDARFLSTVYYASASRRSDTYDLWAWSSTNHTVYELQVRRGVTRFGSKSGLRANPGKSDPAPGTRNWSDLGWAA